MIIKCKKNYHILHYYTAQSTTSSTSSTSSTPATRYWNYKVQIELDLEYKFTTGFDNETLDEIEIATDILVVVDNQTTLSDEDDYKAYVDLIEQFIFVGGTIKAKFNVTVWTDDEDFYLDMKDYLESTDFEDDLIS